MCLDVWSHGCCRDFKVLESYPMTRLVESNNRSANSILAITATYQRGFLPGYWFNDDSRSRMWFRNKLFTGDSIALTFMQAISSSQHPSSLRINSRVYSEVRKHQHGNRNQWSKVMLNCDLHSVFKLILISKENGNSFSTEKYHFPSEEIMVWAGVIKLLDGISFRQDL